MYDVQDVAIYVINYSNQNNQIISNLKLQSILYFIQAKFLIERNVSCFGDDFEIRDFGLIIPIVYKQYQKFGAWGLSSVDKYFKRDEQNILDSKWIRWNDNIFSDEDKKYINEIIQNCSKYSTTRLFEIVRNQKPWKVGYYGCGKKIVSKEAIKNYFIKEN